MSSKRQGSKKIGTQNIRRRVLSAAFQAFDSRGLYSGHEESLGINSAGSRKRPLQLFSISTIILLSFFSSQRSYPIR